ncbi:MAG: MFS transporter [bacterium]
MTRTASPIHYSWVVAAVTLLILVVSAGIRSIPGVLMLPFETEFGWDRATISMAASVNLFLYGMVGPFGASIAERVGIRQTTTGALLVILVGLVITPWISQPWHLVVLWGGLVGISAGMMAGWLGAVVASRWFVARRGVVTGVFSANSAAGQLVFLPVLASVTHVWGWRTATGICAAVIALVAPLTWRFLRDWPSDVGSTAYGSSEADAPAARPRPAGNPFSGAIATLVDVARYRTFWLLASTFFICGASTNGLIGTHLISASHDHGIQEVTAASMLAFIGIFDLIGTTGSGWLTDRFQSRTLLTWYYGLRGISLILLPMAYDAGTFGLGAFIVFYGLDWVATVPPTIRLAADHFGRARVGTVFAWVLASHQLGAAAIAYLAGALRVAYGDYESAFWMSGALCIVAAVLTRMIRRSPDLTPPAVVVATPLTAGARPA